jgi:hypothetical protein
MSEKQTPKFKPIDRDWAIALTSKYNTRQARIERILRRIREAAMAGEYDVYISKADATAVGAVFRAQHFDVYKDYFGSYHVAWWPEEEDEEKEDAE